MSSDILELNRALKAAQSQEQREAEQQRTQKLGQAVTSFFSPVGGSDILGSYEIPVDRMRGGPNAFGPSETTTMDLMAIPNFGLNELRTPANIFGAGLFTKGTQAINKIAGPESGRGMSLASLDNYIRDYYGRKEVGATTPTGQMEGAAMPLSSTGRFIERQLYDEGSATNKMFDFIEEATVPNVATLGTLKPAQKAVAAIKKRTASDKLKSSDFESTPQTRSAAGRLEALRNFAVTGAKNTLRDLFSPESRALFKEQGLTQTGKEIMTAHVVGKAFKDSPEGMKVLEQISKLQDQYKALPRGERRSLTPEHAEINQKIQALASQLPSRGIPKAVAEAIYQLHIGQQAGRRGGLNAGLVEIAKESFLENYNKYDTGTLSSWFTKHNRAKSDSFDVSISKDEAKKLEENIINAHRNTMGEAEAPAIVVMKEPSKPLTSGNHQFDITSTKPKGGVLPPAGKIQAAFRSLGDTPADMNTLESALKEQGLKITGSSDGKLYFSGGTVGSAIVEGGIHVSGFVKPDGTAAFIMSDVHDFFENLKPAKMVADKVIPNSLLAVSPPVFKNFLKPEAITNKAPKKKGSAVDVKKAFEDIAKAKPSAEAVKAEKMRNVGGMLTGAGFTIDGEEEKGR